VADRGKSAFVDKVGDRVPGDKSGSQCWGL